MDTPDKIADGLVEKISNLDREPFHFLLDPGAATSVEIAELFTAMSNLCRTITGFGLVFSVVAARSVDIPEGDN